MTRDEIQKRIVEILSESFELEPDEIKPESTLYEELDQALTDARAALREVRRAAEETQEQIPATVLTTIFGTLF